jgi:MinD-like ATPase involved in chromosome partitioning or flagellar assembly
LCRDWIVVTEASHNAITHTRHLLDEMTDLGIDPKAITVVLNHRTQGDAQLPWNMAQQELGQPIAATISPAPELMAAASGRRLPAVAADPEDVTSQQFLALADRILLPLAAI